MVIFGAKYDPSRSWL